MSSRGTSKDRTRDRSQTPRSAPERLSPGPEEEETLEARGRSVTRSPSRSGPEIENEARRNGSASRSRSRSRTRSADGRELTEYGNGHATRNRSRGVSRSRSRSRSGNHSRDGRRSYRQRSYSRSPNRPPGRRLESSKVVVEKLTKNVTEAHLREIFGSYGKIQSIDLPMNRQFMTNRGTAYIVYESAAGSESATAHMHEAQLDGAVITVSIVLPRRAFSKSPPPARSDRKLNQPAPARYNTSYRDPPIAANATAATAVSRRSPPLSLRRGAAAGGASGGYSAPRMDYDDPRAGGNGNGRHRTRSRSPIRRRDRSYSYDSRSPSQTPPRRRVSARAPPRRRRRSSSFSSYTSDDSRSRTRSHSRNRYNGRR